MRGLVTTTTERLKEYPDIPTAREQGVAPLEDVMGWSGLAGAWLRAEFLLGEEARALGTLGAVLAALVFMALGLASLRRLRAHPAAVRADRGVQAAYLGEEHA